MRLKYVLLLSSILSTIYFVLLSIPESFIFGFHWLWFFIGIIGIIFYILIEKNNINPKKLFLSKKFKICFFSILNIGIIIVAIILTAILIPQKKQTYKESRYLIILGGGIHRDGSISKSLQARLDASIPYLQAHPNIIAIVSGGQGKKTPYPESYAMFNYLVNKGINPERIIQENRSRDTIQNFLYSKKIIFEREKKDVPITLITNRFHLNRSIFLAKRLGFTEITPLAAPSPFISRLHNYTREIVSVLKLTIRIILTGNPKQQVFSFSE